MVGMAARASGSGTVSFGLVSIPVKFYSAHSPQRISFNMLHARCGTRVRMQFYCPHDQEVVERRDTVRGFEHAQDQFVSFSDEEMQRLEGERSDRIDILEFVPEQSVDLTYVEDTHYLGPGKGGDRAYRLLSEAMTRTKRVALGRFGARGREQLVLLRPFKEGLVMHKLFYADEVRPIDEVEFPRNVPFREQELELAERLVEQLSVPRFEPERYPDEYRARVLAAIEEKVAGREVTTAPEAPQAQIIDLFEALKRSLAEQPEAPPPPSGLRKPAPPPAPEPEAEAEEEAPRPGVRKAGSRRRGAQRTGTG